MSDICLSIADEVEAAIAACSPEKCSETTRRVTALFLESARSLDDEQINLFSDVFERLIATIELRVIADVSAKIALAELSSQLASVPQTPAAIVRRLAAHDDISIAGPVLAESARLSADDLVGFAHTMSEKHLLAIAGRWWLKEVVTDALLARHYPSVSRRLVSNRGARISAAGFALIVRQALSDPELAIETGIRVDLPPELRSMLLRHATEFVRARMLAHAPAHLFEQIRDAVVAASAEAGREMAKAGDFAHAKMVVARLKKEGRLDETALYEFAKHRKYEETVTALAELSGSSVSVVRSLMWSHRSDGILVACRAAALDWETVSAVLDCRFSSGTTGSVELMKLRTQYADVTVENAHRMLRLWAVRSSPALARH